MSALLEPVLFLPKILCHLRQVFLEIRKFSNSDVLRSRFIRFGFYETHGIVLIFNSVPPNDSDCRIIAYFEDYIFIVKYTYQQRSMLKRINRVSKIQVAFEVKFE